MKVKVNETIKGVDGIVSLPGDKGHALTLKDVCINAVLTPDEKDDEKKKIEKYDIFKKLRASAEEVTLTTEEANVIKRAVGKINAPLIVGQVFEMFEEPK
jgi:hypothetical protein